MIERNRIRQGWLVPACGVAALLLGCAAAAPTACAAGPHASDGMAPASTQQSGTSQQSGADAVSVTLNGASVTSTPATQVGTLDAQDNVQADLSALQATADAVPGLSAQDKSAIVGRVQAASRDAGQMGALALPRGGQASGLSVSVSAQADGVTISLTTPELGHSLRRVTRQVDIVTLDVAGARS